MEYVDLNGYTPHQGLKDLVPIDVATKYKVAPLGSDGGTLQLVVSDPYDFETLDALPHVLQPDIEFFCSTPALIRTLMANIYGNEAIMGKKVEDLLSAGEDAPIIRLCTNMLMEAFKNGASDIHIEPLEKDVRVRFRIDGVLHDVEHHPKRLLAAIISRFKIMTGTMSIDEKRVPQDGRIQMHYGEKQLDMRVSMIPTNNGESVVMRVLDKSSLRLGLADLGLLSDDQAVFENLITLPDGIVLVTGPTGSGKTTTLYACLNFINRSDRKIITVEDPVEYELAGINQVEVRHNIGLDFARVIRAMLRQAPNVILVGEMRDTETAQMGIQASLTGHLVFSTLHTNDAPSAITRMIDMGVPAYLVASSIIAVVAQRLVRVNCVKCKQPFQPLDTQIETAGVTEEMLKGATFMRGRGCANCTKSGYKGRLGIFELMVMSGKIRELAFQGAPTQDIRRAACANGMRVMFDDGIQKVLRGITSFDEVFRVAKKVEA
jgi:type IV pilus assembly protein PilB